MTHPTLQAARAALDAADAAQAQAQADFDAARDRLTTARQAFYRARREVEAARERDAKNAVARDRRKAQQLAKQYGITIEWERYSGGPGDGVWWVLGPEDIYGFGDEVAADGQEGPVRADPCEGDHTAISWHEVLQNVATYVTDIQAWGAEIAAQLLAAEAAPEAPM